ncbi:MAG TPA: disulfide bond formation protein B [Rhizomicrobium sp.]|jgi:disulfide bond formation protein DsbB|nr:disulfide bond formation protein B [Rhizomicrobium sp.]
MRAAQEQSALAFGNYLYQLLILATFAGILTAAMVMQYAFGEVPCPLYLLQRGAMFGICFGIMCDFRSGFSYRNVGLSLLNAVFLLVVSVRQSLLDIYARPGHAYVGSAVFGVHMPVWSVIISVLLLVAYALQLAVLGGDRALASVPSGAFPKLKRAGEAVSLYVMALLAINLVSVVLQCGFGQCHTFGYALLNG